jgi:hypothetical protein
LARSVRKTAWRVSLVPVVGQRRGLAGRARHDEAVRAVVGEMAHERHEGLLVDAALGVEGRHDRRQDRAEISHRLQYAIG